MPDLFINLKDILDRTDHAVKDFMDMITPTIENAKDEHEHLYWHHIYEEEEQRKDRLSALLPKLEKYVVNEENRTLNNGEFIRLLQDISLEKFGLHNFLEHLDLALFTFKEGDIHERIKTMREYTAQDYQTIKQIVNELNEQFDGLASAAGSIPTDEKEHQDDRLKVAKYQTDHTLQQTDKKVKKRLTVGSLKSSPY